MLERVAASLVSVSISLSLPLMVIAKVEKKKIICSMIKAKTTQLIIVAFVQQVCGLTLAKYSLQGQIRQLLAIKNNKKRRQDV